MALAIGLGACINAAILFYYLRKHNIFTPRSGWLKFAGQLLLALTVMALLLKLMAGSDAQWLQYTLMAKLIHLSILLVVGAGSYFLTLWLLGIRLRHFMQTTVR